MPFCLAGVGIVMRGAAFAFRKMSPTVALARFHGVMFATSSVVTPFLFGTIAGAVAAGRVPADGVGDRWTSWTGPTSLVGGALAVLTCAFLAAVFLTAEAARGDDPELTEACRRRALVTGRDHGRGGAGSASLRCTSDAPTLFDGLTGRALPLVVLSVGRRPRHALGAVAATQAVLARVTAVVAVASIVLGWGVGQWPWLLVDEVEVEDAAGADATLWAPRGVRVRGRRDGAAVAGLPVRAHAAGRLAVRRGSPRRDQPVAPTTAP